MPPPNPTQKTNRQKRRLTEAALRLLKYRPRSRHELTTLLSRKNQNLNLIDQVLDDLAGMDLINDQAFADWLITNRLRQSKGPIIIKIDLKHFGVDPSLVTQSLLAVPKSDLIESASTYLSKKTRLITRHPKYLHKNKAKQLLYRRGFSGEIAALAIDEFLGLE